MIGKDIDLIKQQWTIEDKTLFIKYLKSFSKGGESIEFEKRILNTNYECVAVPSKDIDRIVNTIYKGNFLSFIDLWINDNNASLVITGKLIARIKDFDVFKVYLKKYLSFVDSWAQTDCLKLKIKENDKQKYFDFSQDLIKSSQTFERRMGIIILFKLIDDTYIDKILNICKDMNNESEYYVNMAIAWLVAECFAKYRQKTLDLVKSKTLNQFVQNKAISKCNDSFRISEQDKNLLKQYRK